MANWKKKSNLEEIRSSGAKLQQSKEEGPNCKYSITDSDHDTILEDC